MVAILENPLRVGLQQERTADPAIIVIFGASGDLTQRKLIPCNLSNQKRASFTFRNDHCWRFSSRLES